MTENIQLALTTLTQNWVDQYLEQTQHEPCSAELFGIHSPCIVRCEEDRVYWRPQPFTHSSSLGNVEKAMDIVIHPDVHAFYTTQYAGDISVRFNGVEMSLVQVWSDEDFIRLQENLIGHLFTQRRLKLAPTLFIAALDSELEIISVCNISGEVILEYVGTKKRAVLAPSLSALLNQCEIVIKCK